MPASIARVALLSALLTALSASAGEFNHPDHYEFDASIHAPFRAVDGRHQIQMKFDYPGAGSNTAAAWVFEVVAPDGRVIAFQTGMTRLGARHVTVPARWNGNDATNRAVASGYYTLRVRAAPTLIDAADRRPIPDRVQEAMRLFADEVVVQSLDVQVGDVRPARHTVRAALPVGQRNGRSGEAMSSGDTMTSAAAQTSDGMVSAASVPSTGGLDYTVYYGNFHSQTNHSDGGAPVTACGGSESPQAGQFGPSDAYAMMRNQAGGDFLLTSEHNHMYDGSTGTNTAATPTSANSLFSGGRQAADNFNAANTNFMALYGLEWGVISNGGHLNILNPDVLANWELNSSGQLIGGVNTPKSDYPALYATMKQRGWVGQFNHPASSGQFLVGGTPLGYDANGVDVMAMAEILNTSAFSTNTTQTETSRSTYTSAWNILLERGYKVAPATNQDNHCANWGLSFTNRTGVLLPTSGGLSKAAFIDAVKARRAFASEDKTSQLVLTGNSGVMGQTIANSGPLTLTARFASTSGRTLQRVQFFEGVPRRNGTVTQLFEGADTYTFTPSTGEHFYYALVTQTNGLRLWSAPIWVSQGTVGGGDVTAPTVSASESGTSGTITLSASASDNVGVSRVEFLVDGALKGTDATAPYSMTLDSTTLTNSSHTLVAKAYDAAGNVGSSSSVAFSINNGSVATQLIANGGFELGATSWTATSGAITNSATYAARSGTWKLWLNGFGSTSTEYGYQTVSIPAGATTVTLRFWLRVASDETGTTAYDTLGVQVRNTSNAVLSTLGTFSNVQKGSAYIERTFDVSAQRGKTVRIYFDGKEDSSLATSFLIDDVALTSQ